MIISPSDALTQIKRKNHCLGQHQNELNLQPLSAHKNVEKQKPLALPMHVSCLQNLGWSWEKNCLPSGLA